LELEFEDSTRVLVRPSGTEPKLKIYADAGEALQGSNDSPELALNRADARARSIADEMASWLAKA
jgi:phosphomannomutase